MTPQDMLPLLTNLGFTELSLVKKDDKTVTFKFGDCNMSFLKKTLGAPSVTANGKVAVFEVPMLGRIGVAPSTHALRVLPTAKVTKPKASSSHLAGVEVPEVYLAALEKAKIKPALRVAWMKKMWAWFNEHKFGNRLHPPQFKVLPGTGGTRGYYAYGGAHRPGTMVLADYLFNARPEFILEILLHEICHQAVDTLDKVPHDPATKGHGPHWQAWMKRVGLDPRRFDPTDAVEYMSTKDALRQDAETRKLFGPQTPDTFWKNKKKVNTAFTGHGWLRYKERALDSTITNERGGFKFAFKDHRGHPSSLFYSSWPAGSVYVEK